MVSVVTLYILNTLHSSSIKKVLKMFTKSYISCSRTFSNGPVLSILIIIKAARKAIAEKLDRQGKSKGKGKAKESVIVAVSIDNNSESGSGRLYSEMEGV